MMRHQPKKPVKTLKDFKEDELNGLTFESKEEPSASIRFLEIEGDLWYRLSVYPVWAPFAEGIKEGYKDYVLKGV